MKTEILEGNKLIAEFMDKTWWQAFKKDFYKPLWADMYNSKEECQKVIDRYFNGVKNDYSPKLCFDDEYYTSFDWLKHAIDKFLSIDISEFNYNAIKMAEFRVVKSSLANMPISKSIDDFYNELLAAIKWYNQNNNQ